MADRTPAGATPTRRKGRKRSVRGGGTNSNSPSNPLPQAIFNSGRNENDTQPVLSVPAAVDLSTASSKQEEISKMSASTPTSKEQNEKSDEATESESNTTKSSLLSEDSDPFSSPQGNIGATTDPESYATPPSAQDQDVDVDVDDQVFLPSNSCPGQNTTGDNKDSMCSKTIMSFSSDVEASTSTLTSTLVPESVAVAVVPLPPLAGTSKPEKPPRKISAEKAPPTLASILPEDADGEPHAGSSSQSKDQPPRRQLSIEIDDGGANVGARNVGATTSTPRRNSTYVIVKTQGRGQPDEDPWSGSYPTESSSKDKTAVQKRASFSDLRGAAASFTGRQWSCIILFGLADLFCAMVISLQAPFYPPEAERHGATPSEYGLVFGCYELVVFLTSPIFGKYMNKLGPRLIFNTGITTTATACIAFGFLDQIDDHTLFIALSFTLRILEALGASAFVTSSFAIIAQEFPESVATTFASLETFYGLGLIIGPSVGGGLFEVGGFLLPFATTGGCLFIIGILTFIIMPKIDPISELDGTCSAGQGIFAILKVPGIALATLALIMTSNAIGFLSATLEPHLRPFGLTPTQVGLVFIIYGGVYAVVAPIVGRICDHIAKSSQILLILLGQVLVFCGFLFIGPAPFLPELETSVWLTAVGLIILGLGLAATLVAGFISCLNEAINNGFPDNISTYGVISGLWTSAVSLGAFMGPSAGGFLYDNFSFRRGTYYIFATQAITVVLISLFVLFRPKRSLQGSEQVLQENEPLLGSIAISPILGEKRDKIDQHSGTCGLAEAPNSGINSGYGTMRDSQA